VAREGRSCDYYAAQSPERPARPRRSGMSGAERAPRNPYHVSRQRFIAASPAEIFAVLADPGMHAVIDGSSTVRTTTSGTADRLRLGARFGMDMTMGVSYRVVNVVTEFDEGRRIAWQNGDHNIWRYIITPADGGTWVTEEWDARKSPRRLFMRLLRFPSRNAAAIERTLANLEAHLATRA